MRTISLLLALLSVAAFLTGCGKPEWKQFSWPDGRFAVLMPGTPSTDSATVDTEEGIATVHYFAVEQSGCLYGVTYIDFPNTVTSTPDIDARIDHARGSKVSRGTLLGEQPITLAGYPGREIRFEDSDGAFHCSRVFVAEARLYTVDVITSKVDSASVDISRFLDSFRLTQSGAAAPHSETQVIKVGAFTVKMPSAWRAFSASESDEMRRQFMAQSDEIYRQYAKVPDPTHAVDVVAFHLVGDSGAFAIAAFQVPPQTDLIEVLEKQAEDKMKWGIENGYVQTYLGLVPVDDEQLTGFYVKAIGMNGEVQISGGLEHKGLRGTLLQLTLLCPETWDEPKATNTLVPILKSVELTSTRK